jgi:tRNA pseudouridine55 synthase
MDEQALRQCLINVDKPLESLPAVQLSESEATRIKYGQALSVEKPLQGMVRMYHANVFLGLGEMLLDDKLAPKKLFNLDNEPA